MCLFVLFFNNVFILTCVVFCFFSSVEHSHPALSGCSFSGCSSLPLYRQCPAAVLMVNHTLYHMYTNTGRTHLTLISIMSFSVEWLQHKMFIVQRGFEYKWFNLSQAHKLGLSALTHFNPQLLVSWSRDPTQDKYFIVSQ